MFRLSTIALVVLVAGLLGLIRNVRAATLGCAITKGDWDVLSEALAKRDYYNSLPEGFCGNGTESLFTKYSGCTKKLEDALKDQGIETDCKGFLKNILYDGPEIMEPYDSVIARTAEICSNTIHDAVRKYFCNPLRTVGCPRQLDILKFAIFEKCHSGLFTNWTTEQKAKYFDDRKDRECMINLNVCKDLASWTTCPLVVDQVFSFIDESRKYTCSVIFPTVEERCSMTYNQNHEIYCPPPGFFEKHFYTIVISCTVGPVALCLLFFCYRKVYRAYHISSEEVLKQAEVIVDPATGQSFRMFHPELAAIVESKYKGVSFNPQTGLWSVAGKVEKFEDEQAAARFAYLNLASKDPKSSAQSSSTSSYSAAHSGIVSGDFPVAAYQGETEYVVNMPAAPLSPEQVKQRRLQQLIQFYEYWEPTKSDITAHAENLLNRHDFEHVARAVKTKYGVLPPGWAEELEV